MNKQILKIIRGDLVCCSLKHGIWLIQQHTSLYSSFIVKKLTFLFPSPVFFFPATSAVLNYITYLFLITAFLCLPSCCFCSLLPQVSGLLKLGWRHGFSFISLSLVGNIFRSRSLASLSERD